MNTNSKLDLSGNTWFLNAGDFPDDFVDGVVATLHAPPFLADGNAHDGDLQRFARLVLGSMSLSLQEKNRIFEFLPGMASWQYESLVEVFQDELDEFKTLDSEEISAVRSSMAVLGAFCLAVLRGAGYPCPRQEEAVIRSMAERKKHIHGSTRARVQRYAEMPMVNLVYGLSAPSGSLLSAAAIGLPGSSWER